MSTPILGQAGTRPIEIDVPRLVESRLLLTANSGAGKSWALRRILEQTHGQIQQIVIDPEGEFFTLRETCDLVLAGKGGDCPAEPRSAGLLARKLLELQASAILDVYELPAHQRLAFVRTFLEALVNLPRSLWRPLLVVIDEAHLFAPEKGKAESAAAVRDLATRGRKRGYTALLATQRLSKLDKDCAAECNNLLIGRAALDIDWSRAGDLLGMPKRRAQESLVRLKPGHFYAFGPALTDEVELVKVGDVQSTHPKAGQRAKPPAPPRSKVKRLVDALTDLPAEAEAETRTLSEAQKVIRELKRQVRQAEAARPEPSAEQLERAVARASSDAMGRARAAADKISTAWRGTSERTAAHIDQALGHLKQAADALREPIDVDLEDLEPPQTQTRAARPGRQRAAAVPSAPTRSAPSVIPDGVTRPMQRILDALAWLEMVGIRQPQRTLVGFLSDQSPKSSGFTNNLGKLNNSFELIHYPAGGRVALTEAGRAAAEAPDTPPTAEDLQVRVLERVSAPMQRILRALIAVYPESLPKDELAARSDQSPTSSGYTNNLGKLRNSWELIDYHPPGHVVALPILFLEQQRLA